MFEILGKIFAVDSWPQAELVNFTSILESIIFDKKNLLQVWAELALGQQKDIRHTLVSGQ